MFTEQFVHDNRRVKAFHNFLFEFPFAKNIVAEKKCCTIFTLYLLPMNRKEIWKADCKLLNKSNVKWSNYSNALQFVCMFFNRSVFCLFLGFEPFNSNEMLWIPKIANYSYVIHPLSVWYISDTNPTQSHSLFASCYNGGLLLPASVRLAWRHKISF